MSYKLRSYKFNEKPACKAKRHVEQTLFFNTKEEGIKFIKNNIDSVDFIQFEKEKDEKTKNKNQSV